jgi:hypothetical protein
MALLKIQVNDLPPYLMLLLTTGRIPKSQLPKVSRELLRPLFDGGVLDRELSGRGETIFIRDRPAFEKWLEQRFPGWAENWKSPDGMQRARAILQRRDSKAAARGVAQGVLHFRAAGDPTATVLLNERVIPVGRLTAEHGLAAALIGEMSRLEFQGGVALMENLEVFLNAERIIPQIQIALNSAGRISDRLIACLARSDFGGRVLVHLPDYDPVGLSDYFRLHRAMTGRVKLFLPADLEERFVRFGNRDLLMRKPRNRELFAQLGAMKMPCAASARVFKLMQETGSGLEQEALLLTPANDLQT